GRDVAVGELSAEAEGGAGGEGPADAPARGRILPPATVLLGRDAFRGLPGREPDRHLTSHMFRKRAFTLAWEAGIDMRQVNVAHGCNGDTLMKHYVALDEQHVTDAVFGRMK